MCAVSCCIQDKEFICNAVRTAYKDSVLSVEKADEFLHKIVQVSRPYM